MKVNKASEPMVVLIEFGFAVLRALSSVFPLPNALWHQF